jgi:hypothetical protein
MNKTMDKGRTAHSGKGSQSHSADSRKKGDRFRCSQCGMEVEITADCRCTEPDHVHFQCCGEEMQKL